jgi:hypothetical protein
LPCSSRGATYLIKQTFVDSSFLARELPIDSNCKKVQFIQGGLQCKFVVPKKLFIFLKIKKIKKSKIIRRFVI